MDSVVDWIASSIRLGLWIAVDCVVEDCCGLRRRFVDMDHWCLSCDTYACIMLFMRIALCVLPLTRALLQIHYDFTTTLCLGSGQGGGCGIVVKIVTCVRLSLKGSAACCRYSHVGSLDVRGALIFE